MSFSQKEGVGGSKAIKKLLHQTVLNLAGKRKGMTKSKSEVLRLGLPKYRFNLGTSRENKGGGLDQIQKLLDTICLRK